ncbi:MULTISPECIES: N-acetylmannosamine-6-phosphate 2-epimerase [Bosea]|uniref:N-acetylmannosamine-6-phosphate 2-epimerase n=1 Tax=Bosea TaxID=85413 RepID=UPI0021503787|nr:MULTISPECIES: N-acetylmannosamine-6-phosphate 2-epimerase [Bosea]MCR4521630.1 N-acetylmannosamine-6-phosphate 2-epimerase [Bosea sp. 47.2.35]MDR6829375.1 putative N-acetylmannosamine-6-phosphate epimerase [Bosea robiniae]MDR6896110.1 putative N-acetylmannosamine-6-phosphate epimerase [Bosea sp. BE109]MDR7139656.1 putative N-acetylmannosamine-6-phosphate epimerase [Bosea sp. BE168]MDR7176205.1 putative N-acetylmannosamine-6-phosphate epimerase [Bosea sp. BE271]
MTVEALIPRRSLAVSCQARADNPLHGPAFMAAMAQAAEQGGALAFRANGPADIAAIRAVSRLPIIGILKRWDDRFPVYITPDFASAAAISVAGADIIAVDATARARDGEPLERLIARIRDELGKPVFADCATLEDGVRAATLGASYIATTLSGYTPETEGRKALGPDIALIEALAKAVSVPIIAEGRFEQPEQLERAFTAGAHAVVVGTAITNPREITRRFVRHAGA